MKTCRVFISGFVQGVGFRQYVRSKASNLNLTGWVKNLPDGRVEAVLQGPKGKVQKLIKELDKGPFLSEVKDLVVDWEERKEVYKSFEIL